MNMTPSAQATASSELGLADAEQPAQLGDVEQADRRGDDDRRQHRLRHRLDEAGHEQQHHQRRGPPRPGRSAGSSPRTGRPRPSGSRSCSPGSRRTGRRPGWPSRSPRAPGCRPPRSRRERRSHRRSRSCRRWRRARSPARRRRAAGCPQTGTAGKRGRGKPWGSTPITETPCAARSSTIESPIATTTAMRMPGVRGESRLRPRMMTRLRRPIPSAHGFVSPSEALEERRAPRRRGRWRRSRTRTAWAAGR